MRKLVRLIVILLVVLAIGVFAGFYYLDSLARHAIERGATYATGTRTSVQSADVRPLRGEVHLAGLRIDNPEGYSNDHFLELERGETAVSLASLRQPTVRLPHLTLDEIDMHIEKREGKANYDVILENLKKLSSKKPADPDAKKYVIETVTLRKIMVHLDVLGRALDVPIERITLENVGTGGEGIDIAQLSGVIVHALFQAVVKEAGQNLPRELLGDLNERLRQIADLDQLAKIADIESVGEVIESATGAARDAAEEAARAADELANKAKEGLGGILGGDKKD